MSLDVRIRSAGRGTGYRPLRGLVESSLRVLYRGSWPARLWEAVPGSCEVASVQHRLPILPSGHPPRRVGFISDIHVGPTTPRRLVEAAFAKLALANLDVLLLGGDYVFLDVTEEAARFLADQIASVPARRKLAVLGNHDLWTYHPILERAFLGAGVEFLTNRSTLLDVEHPEVVVVGLDDPWTGVPDEVAAFRGLQAARSLIVLCHSPDGLPPAWAGLATLHGKPEVLYVCGHTHGGHIASPWGPVVIPGKFGKRYPSGLHDAEGLRLYVSRGVGGIELPIRAYAKPEVAVFDLTAPEPFRTP